jgi:hypothetical protein
MDTGSKLGSTVTSAEDGMTAAIDSVAGAVDAVVGRGRKARKAARAEVARRQKLATKKAKKRSRKARRRADKMVSDAQSRLADARADAAFRAQALSAAAHGKPKRGKVRRLVGLLGLAGAVVVAVRARGNTAATTPQKSGGSGTSR